MTGNVGRAVFFAVWALLLTGSFAALHFEGRLQLGHGDAVASLKERSGTVQYRPRNMPIWSYATSGQYFYDGNVVATGAEASASIELDNGRELVVGPNSQIALASSSDARGDYVVTLLSGTLTAQTTEAKKAGLAKTKAGSLVVKVKDKTVTVSSVESVLRAALTAAAGPVVKAENAPVEVRSTGVAEARVVAAGETVKLTKEPARAQGSVKLASTAALKVTEEPAALPPIETLPVPETAAVEPEPEPKAEPRETPKPVIPAVKLAAKALPKDAPKARRLAAPRVRQPLPGTTLWTAGSLAAGQATPLPISLDGKSEGGKSDLFVQLPASKTLVKAEGTRATISAAQLARAASADGGAGKRTLRLRPGARSGSRQELGAPVVLRLGSLADLGSNPVRVSLATVASGGAGGAWLAEAKALPAPGAVLTLKNGRDLAAAASLLTAAGSFLIEPAAALPDASGLQLARGGRVLASATFAASDQAAAATLRKALKADLVFRGRASELVEGFGGTPAAKRQALVARLQKGKAIYVLQGAELVRIEATLLQTNPSALALIADTATAVFTDRVEILAAGP